MTQARFNLIFFIVVLPIETKLYFIYRPDKNKRTFDEFWVEKRLKYVAQW